MKVILNRDIRKLGKVGDVVVVKDGYGRNFLLPRKYAFVATKENIAKLEEKIEELKAKNESLLQEAKKVVDILSVNIYNVVRQASDDDIIYGSVRTKDVYNFICSLLKQNNVNFPLEIGGINISDPIKTLGQHVISVEIFSDIVSNIRVNVCRTTADFELDVDKFDKKREKTLMSDKDAKVKEKNAEKLLSEQINDANKNQKDNDMVMTMEKDNKNAIVASDEANVNKEEGKKLLADKKKETKVIHSHISDQEEEKETKIEKKRKSRQTKKK